MDTACDCSALQHCPFIRVLLKSCVLRSDALTTVHPMDTACDCSALQHCPFIRVLLQSCVLQSDTRTTVHPTLHQYTHYFFPIPTNPCCIYPHSVPHWSFPSPSPSPQYTQLHTNNMLYILKYILCGTCRCRFLQLQSIDRQQAVVVDA